MDKLTSFTVLSYINEFSDLKENGYSINTVLNGKDTDVDIWHCRLGHPGNKILEHIFNNFSYVQSSLKSVCDLRHLSKQHKLSFFKSDIVSLTAFYLINSDIWSPISIPSIHDHKYFLTIVNDYTRHTWIYLIKAKSETRPLLYNFVIFSKNQFGRNIKIITSDNGKEFILAMFMTNLGF